MKDLEELNKKIVAPEDQLNAAVENKARFRAELVLHQSFQF